MNTTAIVYTSGTGFTARYAAILSEKTGLPALPLAEAMTTIPAGAPVIYMGWVMAGTVVDVKKAAKHFAIQAVVGVCLADTGAQDEAVRKACRLPADVPVFTVQGGMDHRKLKGGFKVGITILTKVMAAKKNRSPEEDKMLDLLLKGGDYVNEKHLAGVMAWWRA